MAKCLHYHHTWTLSIYRGLVFLLQPGTWVNSYEFPDSFKQLSKGTPLGLPNMVIIAIIVAAIVYYFLNYTRTGRDIFAVGSNPDAAVLAGIRKRSHHFLVYVLSGLLAGLAAVLWASRFESAQTNTALGFELQTVAASVVGGVSISGGVGTVPGVLLALYCWESFKMRSRSSAFHRFGSWRYRVYSFWWRL